MDALFNNVSAGRNQLGNQQLLFSEIPVDDSAKEHGQTTFHAKESRLWFKSFTPTNWGDMNTYLEMDFFGDAATFTYTPRLRHAYGTFGNFLGGQTWTTFLDVAALPESLDAIGVSAGAVSNFRQPLIRWTQPFAWNAAPLEVQFALEAPRSRVWVPATQEGNGGPNFVSSDLLWSPVKEAMMGVEYIYANWQLIDHRDGTLHRFQLSARYNF